MFPHHQLGVELGAILLIFTGQVWNMAFSFYSSLKSIPRDMREAASIYRFNWYQRFTQLEVPYAAIGLVWNSMMSVAGGWFFLMACEMFVLGSKDFRLPGLGSYLQTAASAGDTPSILWGIATMIAVIVVIDQVVWRPVIAWAEKFKIEQVESTDAPQSWFLDLIERSRALKRLRKRVLNPIREYLRMRFAHQHATSLEPEKAGSVEGLGRAAHRLGCRHADHLCAHSCGHDARRTGPRRISRDPRRGRRNLPARHCCAGHWIAVDDSCRRRDRLQSAAGENRAALAQVAASVPATALFPIVLLMLIRVGGGLGLGSIVLLLLGTQWYILFNVIAGAMAIPTDLKEASTLFRFSSGQRWRQLILPGIFPYLVTGLVTASGGAWNASIVAEYFRFKDQTYTTVGLGAVISRATDAGNFALLLGSTVVMAMVVVTINRLVWRRMYRLAAERYTLET